MAQPSGLTGHPCASLKSAAIESHQKKASHSVDPLVIVVAAVLAIFLFVQVHTHWRLGLFFIIAVGFLQDPVRKLVPGEPVVISIAVGVVMLFVWGMGMGQFRGQAQAMSIGVHYPSVTRAFAFFCSVVFLQAMVTLLSYGSLPLAGIGLIAYLSPLPAIWVGWWFCRSDKDYLQLALTQVAFAVVLAVTVFLSWQGGAEWALFKQVGDQADILVFYGDAGIITMHTGLMRAPEVTAWHLGAATCIAIVSATLRPTAVKVAALAFIVAFLIAAIYLTGRRKALGMIVVFTGLLIVLLQFSRRRDARSTGIALLGVAAAAVVAASFLSDNLADGAGFRAYSERGDSAVGDAWERFYSLGISSLGWAIDAAGFFGAGAGVISQGGQHFGSDENLAGAGEGGLAKIIIELGVPGLVVVTWVLTVLVRTVRRLLAFADQSSAQAVIVTNALSAFLVTNMILFVTASQVFGDPFVLILLGILFGALLATPRLLASPRAGVAPAQGAKLAAPALSTARFGKLQG